MLHAMMVVSRVTLSCVLARLMPDLSFLVGLRLTFFMSFPKSRAPDEGAKIKRPQDSLQDSI
jgi:hypothetical protein